jgi:hypothetical protein
LVPCRRKEERRRERRRQADRQRYIPIHHFEHNYLSPNAKIVNSNNNLLRRLDSSRGQKEYENLLFHYSAM